MKARWILPVVCAGLAALLAFPVAQAGDDDDSDSEELVGTWRITVFDPSGFPSFFLTSFHADNTLTEPSGSPSGSSGVGVWEAVGDDDDDSDSDRSDYAATFDAFEDSDFDNVFDLRLQIRNTFQLEGDTMTGTATVLGLTLDNSQLLFVVSGLTLEGTRMAVIRE